MKTKHPSKLQTLTQVRFNLRRNVHLSYNGIKLLSKAIGHFKNITALGLDCSKDSNTRSKTSEISLKWLSRPLSIMRTLTSIDLSFCGVFTISDHGLTKLSGSLWNLKRLSSITLNLTDGAITNQGLIKLSTALSNHPDLTSLTLKCSGNSNITDGGLAALSDGLTSLTNLTTLSLDFNMIPDISDNGITKLSVALSNKKRLTSLFLKFYGSQKILDSSLKRIIEAISSLKKLTAVELNLRGRLIHIKPKKDN